MNADDKNKEAIKFKKEIGDYLLKTYSMFKVGIVKRPNVNVDLFLNNLQESVIFPYIKDLDDFKIVFDHYNNSIRKLLHDGADFRLAKSNVSKCKQSGVYFGLYLSFVFDKEIDIVIQKLNKQDLIVFE